MKYSGKARKKEALERQALGKERGFYSLHPFQPHLSFKRSSLPVSLLFRMSFTFKISSSIISGLQIHFLNPNFGFFLNYPLTVIKQIGKPKPIYLGLPNPLNYYNCFHSIAFFPLLRVDLMYAERVEEYLETILYLIMKNQGPAKTTQIAEELNVSPPSVTEMIKKLSAQGLVEYIPYKGVEFTYEGAKQALKLKRKQQVLETFLTEILDFDRKAAHNEACELEHAVSDTVLEKLYEYLGKPDYCPDGNPINLDRCSIGPEISLVPLDEMKEGASGTIFRVALSKETKKRLNSLGLLPGEKLEIKRKQKQGSISVNVVGSEVALGKEVAKRIFVNPL